jgi:hypothetical protein
MKGKLVSQTSDAVVSPEDEQLFADLAADYEEIGAVVTPIAGFVSALIKTSREMDIPEEQIWAAIAIHCGRMLGQDLNTKSGRVAACLLATLFMQQAG